MVKMSGGGRGEEKGLGGMGTKGRPEEEQSRGRAHPSAQPWQLFTQLVNQGRRGERAALRGGDVPEKRESQRKMRWTGGGGSVQL